MRPYPQNSPQAVARIVALTLVSDGRLDDAKLAMLKRIRAFPRMGLSEEGFLQVLNDFCRDLLADTSDNDAACHLEGDDLLALLDDIDNPVQQKLTLRLMLDLIRANGHLVEAESLLFWQALEHWTLQLSDVVGVSAEKHGQSQEAAGDSNFRAPSRGSAPERVGAGF